MTTLATHMDIHTHIHTIYTQGSMHHQKRPPLSQAQQTASRTGKSAKERQQASALQLPHLGGTNRSVMAPALQEQQLAAVQSPSCCPSNAGT